MLWLQAESGISGDMFAAALLDLGADEEVLRAVLQSLPLEGFEGFEVRRVKKAGIDCCDLQVLLDHAHENRDHDMAYLHGQPEEAHGHCHDHGHGHEDGHGHTHGSEDGHSHDSGNEDSHAHESEDGHDHDHAQEHAHGHDHEHAHGHAHRTLADVRSILAQGTMTDRARETADRIFRVLAEAEAEAHGTTLEEVHFHEVGAVDSIVDIVAAAVLLDDLDVREVVVPYLCEGQGTVRTQHGVLPVPVPAVTSIVRRHGITLRGLQAQGEFVTPTGAAICAAVRTREELPDGWQILRTGCGAGKREYAVPSLLRAMLIESSDSGSSREDPAGAEEGPACHAPAEEGAAERDSVWKLETNIDDCSGEVLAYVSGLLMEAGARDVHFLPVYMKKGRPGWQIDILCTEDVRETMERILFRETTTIGVRRVRMERAVLPREAAAVRTSAGDVQVKVCTDGDRRNVYPEYESVAALARETGRPFLEIFREAEQQV